jgi:FAD/FMN-containing dehydrogenase
MPPASRLRAVDDHLRRQIVATVGARGLDRDDVVRPINVAQLREVLGRCAAASVTVVGAGRPRSTAAVVVDAGGIAAITLNPSALLLHAGAAATWTAIREAAAAQDLAVSGLPSVRSDSAGASVALGEISHRTLAGVDLLTVAGQFISAGGRTLKDVVGYDLPGLVLGSGDCLGTIVAVTLRVEPSSARTPMEAGAGPWRGDAGVDLVAAFAARAASGDVAGV